MGFSNNIVNYANQIKLKLIVMREERGTPEATCPGESILYQLVAPLEKQNKGIWIISPKSITSKPRKRETIETLVGSHFCATTLIFKAFLRKLVQYSNAKKKKKDAFQKCNAVRDAKR